MNINFKKKIIILIGIIVLLVFSFFKFKYLFKKDFLVSVVIPAYNVELYIKECLDSVINQTYKNLEIIVIDDFSTDNTVKIIEKYKDERIKFYKNELNLGVSSTRNKGIEKANGEYIYFLDSDDFIDKDYIKNFVINAKKYNADVVVSNNIKIVKQLDNETEIEEKKLIWNLNNKSIYYKDEINLSKQYYNLGNKFIKTLLIRNNNIIFNKNISYGEDQLFAIQTLIHSNIIIQTDNNSFYNYRKRPNSLTVENFKENKKRINELLKVVNLLYKYINEINCDKEIYINVFVSIFDYLRQIIINLNIKSQLDQKFYDKIRDTFILVLNNIIDNKHLYDKNILIQYINLIKYEDYLSYSEWVKKFRPTIIIPEEKWYNKILYKFL